MLVSTLKPQSRWWDYWRAATMLALSLWARKTPWRERSACAWGRGGPALPGWLTEWGQGLSGAASQYPSGRLQWEAWVWLQLACFKVCFLQWHLSGQMKFWKYSTAYLQVWEAGGGRLFAKAHRSDYTSLLTSDRERWGPCLIFRILFSFPF